MMSFSHRQNVPLLAILGIVAVLTRFGNAKPLEQQTNIFERASSSASTPPLAAVSSEEEEITYRAQDGLLRGGSKLATNKQGYSGDGFIDFGGVGSSVTWLVDIPRAGWYDATIRYASKGQRAPLELMVNDAKVGSFTIPPSPNWNTWKVETIRVRLEAGTTRRFQLLASVVQGPNVDELRLQLAIPDDPPPPPDGCEGFCQGASSAHFGCEADVPGHYALGCHPNGGCYYRATEQDDYPYAGFCTYKVHDDDPPPQTDDVDYHIILDEDTCLEEGSFVASDSGLYDFGLDRSGYLVVRSTPTLAAVWSFKASEDELPATVPPKICLQSDGNVVILPYNEELAPCDNTAARGLFARKFGFKLGINNYGRVAVFLDPIHLLWIGGPNTEIIPTAAPVAPPTPASVTPITIPPTTPPEDPTATPVAPPTPITLPPTDPPVDPIAAPVPPPTSSPVQPTEQDLQYKTVLSQNNYFGRDKQNFGQSLSGDFEVGVNGHGHLIVRKTDAGTVWVLKDSNGSKVIGAKLYMQMDGNLVMRRDDRSAVWTSKTASSNGSTGYSFGINNCGGVAVFRGSNSTGLIWTGGIQDTCLKGNVPSDPPNASPVRQLSSRPTSVPIAPSPKPPSASPTPYSVVIPSNRGLFERNRFIPSPNNDYEVGLTSNGKLVIRKGRNDNTILWTLEDKTGTEVINISKMYMQADGNLVMKTSSNTGVWRSETSNNPAGEFRLDDTGQLSVNYQGTSLWIDGLPRATYTGPSSSDIQFPIRGYFYYAWYPETWSVEGEPVFYRPNLGSIGEKKYKSGDPLVVENHVRALDYGWADLAIVSWWGQSDRLDRARITQLMDETVAQDSSIKWTVYYEDEKKFDYSVNQLVEDLNYLKKWFAWHKAWAHKDGKPVIFIWNESDCQVADRWTTAAKAAGWYVVLKLFRKYDDCSAQPDSWHQYGLASTYLEYPSSFTIGPGFWRSDMDQPDHPRTSRTKFCEWVVEMNSSNRDWQLIVSFNEWGEGTAVESAVEWQSDSGYGIYLDCLHDPVLYGQ